MNEYSTWLRAIVALTVVSLSYWLTTSGNAMSSEWEAVFLIVIGYYFKDRPVEDGYDERQKHVIPDKLRESRDYKLARQEIDWQFYLAMLLLLGTFIAFVYPSFKPRISGVWIGAVALAIGFYFKDTDIDGLIGTHHRYQATLAVTLTILSAPLFYFALRAPRPAGAAATDSVIPLQWIALVFIVVTFYFKERATKRVSLRNDRLEDVPGTPAKTTS